MSPLYKALCKAVAYLLNKHTPKPLSSLDDSEFPSEEKEEKKDSDYSDYSGFLRKEKKNSSIYYAVPLIKQEHAFTCQDASEAMVKHFFGIPIPSQVRNLRWFGQTKYNAGEGTDQLESDLKTHGFTTYYPPLRGRFDAREDIQYALDKHGPCIISLPLKMGLWHSVVCVGHTKDHIIYHDPFAGGNLCLSFSDLEKLAGSVSDGRLPIRVRHKEDKYEPDLLAGRGIVPAKKTPFKTHQHQTKHAKFFALQDTYKYSEREACERAIQFLQDYASGWGWRRDKNSRDQMRTCVEELRQLESTTKGLTKEGLLGTIEKYAGKKMHHEAKERIEVIQDLFPRNKGP